MGDPTPGNPDELSIETLRENLAREKAIFSKKILENDVLFSAIQSILTSDSVASAQLSDFHLEPWRPESKEEGMQTLGVRLTQSATGNAGEPGFTIGVGQYSYLPIMILDLNTGDAIRSDEIKASNGSPEEQVEACGLFFSAYKDLLVALGLDKSGSKYGFHPVMHTLDTLHDISREVSFGPEPPADPSLN